MSILVITFDVLAFKGKSQLCLYAPLLQNIFKYSFLVKSILGWNELNPEVFENVDSGGYLWKNLEIFFF